MNVKAFEADYYRMTGKNWKGGKRKWLDLFLYHHIRFMYWYRKFQTKPTAFRRFVLYRFSRKFGLEISPKATIGEGLYLGHPYNITVGADAVLGRNVNLYKGCTIGKTNTGKHPGTPTIGNDVYVGINATLVGNIHIGDDVMIASNALVNMDVPPHSVVIGNPAKIIPHENATEGYVIYRA